MKVIKHKDQKTINSDTCGSLLEVINRKDFPFGIVLSENIKTTKAHYHKESQKCYWVLEGSITVRIENVKTNESQEVVLNEGDLITFEPYEKHQITSASDKNKMVTITSPAWHVDDVVSD